MELLSDNAFQVQNALCFQHTVVTSEVAQQTRFEFENVLVEGDLHRLAAAASLLCTGNCNGGHEQFAFTTFLFLRQKGIAAKLARRP